jgi:hypothetical protein
MRNQKFLPYKALLFALAVSACFQLVWGSASARLPVFCEGNAVPGKFAGNVVLLSNAANVAPGGYVYTRLLNGLNRPVGLGNRYIQRYAEGSWKGVQPPPRADGAPPIVQPAVRRRLAAASAGECRRSRIDPGKPSGLYRVVNEVWLDLAPGVSPRFRVAEFRVIDGPEA